MDRDREHREHRSHSDETSDRPVAHRLDRLTSEEAEQVILRALELTDADMDLGSHGTLDVEALEVAAEELNIPIRHLRSAMAEQRAKSKTAGDDPWFDRLLKIDTMDGAAIVRGNVDAVHRAIVTWFQNHEGLRAVHIVGNRGEWEKDTNPLTALRMGLGMTNSSKSLRGAGTVSHEITSLGPDEHIVSIEAGKDLVRNTGRGLLVGAAALATAAGVAISLGPGNIGSGLLAALWTALLFGTGAVAIVRSWAGRISKSIRRALSAITDPATSGVFDSLPGSFGRFLRGFGLGRKR